MRRSRYFQVRKILSDRCHLPYFFSLSLPKEKRKMPSSRYLLQDDDLSTTTGTTFEATRARERNSTQADPIHWERERSYRNQAYRYLHHQNGWIGTFQIRLLEASNLKRSYWSPLGLGPVQFLGLSKAHGEVSSYVSFSLDNTTEDTTHAAAAAGGDSKPAAKDQQSQVDNNPPFFVSPVIPNNDNPVWTNCVFELPLPKGALKDGQSIRLSIRVDEDSTVVENILPGVPSGGDSRLLGTGCLDITSLCLGQILDSGRPQVGVLDTWISISNHRGEGEGEEHHQQEQELKKEKQQECGSGSVRLLVSYQPNGMEPQPNDVIALEAFARQQISTSSCRPIINPLAPLRVVKTCGPWLLAEYNLSKRRRQGYCDDNKAMIRLYRNAVFVIERKTMIDETLHLALLPTDIFLDTPLGRVTKEILGPAIIAGRQLLMPALLSSKLVWMAVRTTALASLTGVRAATSAFVNEGSSSLLTEGDDSGEKHQSLHHKTKRGGNFKVVTL